MENKIWNAVEGFDPNDSLICYRKTEKNADGTARLMDTLYMPLRAMHEWFLRCHPDGSVLIDKEFTKDNGIHAVVRAVVSYDGREVSDGICDGWKESRDANGVTVLDKNYLSKAARLAKRYALSVAGFGMPGDAKVTDRTPIIEVTSGVNMPDESMGITMEVPIPPIPGVTISAPAPVAAPAPVPAPAIASSNPITDANANLAAAPKKRGRKPKAMVPPIDVPTPIVPPMSVMVEDEEASKPADVPAVQETTAAPEVPAETNKNPEPLDGNAQAELLASAQPEPSMTYEQALQCTIPTGKYRDMTIDAARRLDGNNKVIPTFLKGWYKNMPIQKAAAIIARHEGLDYKELETITIE